MKLYLVQHGVAAPKEADPERPLTAEGADAVRAMGDFLYAESRLVVPEILHSGKLRAAQTADILARCLNAAFLAGPDLKPADDPGLWSAHASARDDDVMLVGHLPHLDRLASLLLTGDPDTHVIRFHNAGVVCLASDGGWHLEWAVIPALLGAGRRSGP